MSIDIIDYVTGIGNRSHDSIVTTVYGADIARYPKNEIFVVKRRTTTDSKQTIEQQRSRFINYHYV